MKKFFTLIAATLVAGSAFAQGEGFVNVINNGDLDGTDMTNFKVNDYWQDGTRHPESGDPVNARIMVDKGERYIVVGSNDNPANEWDAQFFVTVPEDQALKEGTQIQLKMKVKADRAQNCSGQVHTAPGTYVWNLQFNVPAISFTTEWTNYDSGIMTVKGDGTRTLAFNLADKGTKLANTFYFDDLELWVKRPRYETVENWLNLVINGECEGTDGSCIVCREKGKDDSFYQAVGEGVEGSTAAVTASIDNAVDGWDTQFFITSVHQFAAGEPYKVKFSVRADANASVSLQAHAFPGGYIGGFNPSSINVTTEWQDFEFMGAAPAPHAQNGPFQSIAFNLNDNKTLATKFYFDNIEFCIDATEATEEDLEVAEKIAAGYTGEEVPTAISSVKVNAAKTIFNVAGQQIKSLQKGLNIVNGEKVYVK